MLFRSQVSLYLRDRTPAHARSVPPGAGELKILIACYDGTDRTDRHIPDRRALPRQVRGAGRLFFRTGSDPLPRAGSRVETLNLCGAGREDAFHFTFTPNCVGKILYDSDTSSSLVEYLQKMSSDYGYTMEQQ